jgi:hypothetical protein
MDNVFNPPLTVTRRVGLTESRRGRPHKNNSGANALREPVGAVTLTRTKSLLGAALRVWELKQRIND